MLLNSRGCKPFQNSTNWHLFIICGSVVWKNVNALDLQKEFPNSQTIRPVHSKKTGEANNFKFKSADKFALWDWTHASATISCLQIKGNFLLFAEPSCERRYVFVSTFVCGHNGPTPTDCFQIFPVSSELRGTLKGFPPHHRETLYSAEQLALCTTTPTWPYAH